MTLSSTTTKTTYTGDGSTTAFATGFRFIQNSHVKVVERVIATGAETTLTETTHYTLTGADDASGGTVTAVTAPASTVQWIVKRATPETQGSSLPAGGAFPSATVEQMVDLLTMLVQQHSEEISRALVLAETSPTGSITLPEPSANKLLGWNSGATDLENKGAAATSVTTTAFIDTLLDDADAATALATLTAAGTGIVNTFTKTQSWTKGADIASAATLVLGTGGNYFDVTGAVAITAITVVAGTFFGLQFDGALTLTHHATNLDLPGEANITTAAGDVGVFYATGANTVQCVAYTKADGKAVVVVAAGGKVAVGLITHTSDTALATQGAGGSQMGAAVSMTVPTAGQIRITIVEIEYDETEGSSGGAINPGLKVGADSILWATFDEGDGTAHPRGLVRQHQCRQRLGRKWLRVCGRVCHQRRAVRIDLGHRWTGHEHWHTRRGSMAFRQRGRQWWRWRDHHHRDDSDRSLPY